MVATALGRNCTSVRLIGELNYMYLYWVAIKKLLHFHQTIVIYIYMQVVSYQQEFITCDHKKNMFLRKSDDFKKRKLKQGRVLYVSLA